MTPMDHPTHAPARSPLDELERQVERGSMFTQAVLQKSFTRLSLVEAVMGELVEVLTDKGVLSLEDIPGVSAATAAAAGRDEPEPDEDHSAMLRWPAIAIREDPDEPPETEAVDCDARMATCHAVCCKLKFALSGDEVERGVVKWDIGHPYIIRQSSTGYCCHNSEGGGCGVYDNRPGVCRRYSCRHDDRIWTDFDNMVLNQEWIDAHIVGADAFLLVDVTRPTAESAPPVAAEP
jgi:hypothetical protein